MDGFINLLKPTGMTSNDVVQVLRRMLKERKIGHTGTLDPMAVGVLPMCIGSATRLTEYLDLDTKKYRCEMMLGVETDTGDIWGDITSKQSVGVVEKKQILEIANTFIGDIMQTPPLYSAIRVNGKRLYQYARNGESVTVKPRLITITSLDIIDFTNDRILFDTECSKGTYIRTICTEIGRILGCGGTMSFLARTASGKFDIDKTVTFEELDQFIKSSAPEQDYLFPPEYPLDRFKVCRLSTNQANWFINGGHLRLSEIDIETGNKDEIYKVFSNKTFLGMATINPETNKIVPDKVFCRKLGESENENI